MPPAWLQLAVVPGRRTPVTVQGTPAGAVDLVVWSPRKGPPHRSLPMLLAHDGPEMDRRARRVKYVAAMVRQGELPPMRLALLAPGPRDERYAADPAYSEALTGHVLPQLTARFPTEHPPVLAGASLGALAALHAAWTSPGTFGGLFLQSGSYFTPELDPQGPARPAPRRPAARGLGGLGSGEDHRDEEVVGD